MRGAGMIKQQIHLMRAFDNHKIMVLKMLSALNIRVYQNIGVLKLICETWKLNWSNTRSLNGPKFLAMFIGKLNKTVQRTVQ